MQYGNYLNNEYRVDLEIDDHELNHDTIRDIVVRDGWLVYEDKVARGAVINMHHFISTVYGGEAGIFPEVEVRLTLEHAKSLQSQLVDVIKKLETQQ
jgi:hypothetical protein